MTPKQMGCSVLIEKRKRICRAEGSLLLFLFPPLLFSLFFPLPPSSSVSLGPLLAPPEPGRTEGDAAVMELFFFFSPTGNAYEFFDSCNWLLTRYLLSIYLSIYVREREHIGDEYI